MSSPSLPLLRSSLAATAASALSRQLSKLMTVQGVQSRTIPLAALSTTLAVPAAVAAFYRYDLAQSPSLSTQFVAICQALRYLGVDADTPPAAYVLAWYEGQHNATRGAQDNRLAFSDDDRQHFDAWRLD